MRVVIEGYFHRPHKNQCDQALITLIRKQMKAGVISSCIFLHFAMRQPSLEYHIKFDPPVSPSIFYQRN